MDQGKFFVAGTLRRVFAFVVDESLRVIAFLPVWIHFIGKTVFEGTLAVPWLWMIACYLFHLMARTLFLKFGGATPGKWLFGLRLISRNRPSGELAWSQCWLRCICDDVSTVVGLATRTLALIRFDRTHLSDWLAETRVVQLMPRSRFPHRRWIVASFLFVVTAHQGLKNSTWWMQTIAGVHALSIHNDTHSE